MRAEGGGSSSSGELIQIVILTLFITSGFLGVASLIFGLMIPSRRSDADAQARDLNNLIKTFRDPQVLNVRDSFEQFRREIGGLGIRDVIRVSLGGLKNNVEHFPITNIKPIGNTVAYTQKLKIKDAKLQPVFDFLARVRQKHRGVHAGDINLTRGRGRGAAKASDLWNVDLTFYLYQNKEIEKLYKKVVPKDAPKDPPDEASPPAANVPAKDGDAAPDGD